MFANPRSNWLNTIAVRASYILPILRWFPWWKPRKTRGVVYLPPEKKPKQKQVCLFEFWSRPFKPSVFRHCFPESSMWTTLKFTFSCEYTANWYQWCFPVNLLLVLWVNRRLFKPDKTKFMLHSSRRLLSQLLSSVCRCLGNAFCRQNFSVTFDPNLTF